MIGAPPSTAAAPVVALPSELVIAEAAALRTLLASALRGVAPGGTLRLDAGAVEAVDGAGLSLLCALGAELQARRATVALSGASTALRAAAALAGAGALLGLEDA